MSFESYAHKAAKAVVMGWLRGAEDARPYATYASCLDTAWFQEDNGPHFWEEYPILADGTGLFPVWFHPPVSMATREEGPPSYETLLAAGRRPTSILDVAILDPCYIRTGIEIVHKNPPSKEKLAFLRNVGLTELLVLPARWVLGQIGEPRDVPKEFWAWR